MRARLRLRTQRRDGQYVLKLEGEVDGSTACRALNVLAATAPRVGELVLDLSGLTAIEPFGLDVLSRGLRTLGRARRVRFEASERLLPVLSSLADTLLAEHAP